MMEKTLGEIIENAFEGKDFFRLRDLLAMHWDDLCIKDRLFYSLIVDNAFDRIAQSESKIADYLMDHASDDDTERKLEVLKIHADNLLKSFRYEDAASIYEKMLVISGDNAEDEEMRSELANSLSLWKAVSHVAPMDARIDYDTTIPYNRNMFGHIMIETATDQISCEFMLDTGANVSSVRRSLAERMGMDIFDADINVLTSTGIWITTEVAVAKRIRFGSIWFENVIFLVMNDRELTFEELDYTIDGIIGIPVIRQMGQITIENSNIFIPRKPIKKTTSNLCFENLMPLIAAKSGNEDLIFTFDTGANRSELSYRYYMRNREAIESTGKELLSMRGGGGGVVDFRSYEIDDFPLTLGNKEILVPKMSVSTHDYLFNKDKDGNMGLDVIIGWSRTTICFKYMYVEIE